ncbi:MAG: ribosomal protein S18-alanine N-acetyltransferase [Bacteroidaceae bacterium]|nr:ribosomal protein S18-alanine N-acetyltransferase [Bacteroidaceae bacterium]
MIIFRQASADELNEIACLEAEVMPQPWSFNSFEGTFDSDSGHIYVAYEDNDRAIAGFVVLYETIEDGEIPDVVVNPRYRRQGVGYGLMNHMISENPQIKNYFLEVREHNQAAIGLYKKLGFEAVGVRKAFYANPVEDAWVMSLNL